MALGESAKLVAELDLKNNMSGPAGQAIASLDRIEKKVGTLRIATGTALGNAFTSIGSLAVKGLGKAFGALEAGIDSLRQVDTLNRQTAAVIQSTGAKAGISAKQVSDLAGSIEDLTTVDDKVVQGGENMLLTFTGIGKDVFPDATKAMVNMGVAMAGGNADAVDLQATAIQLGKALNDPIKGVTALAKVGVSFTEQQKAQIKAMVEAGDVAGAQKVILKELETEFGKAGEAAGTGYAADMRRFNDAIEGAEQAVAVGFMPVIQEVTKWLNEKLRDPKVIAAIKDLGTSGAGLLDKGFQAIKNIPWDQVGEAFKLMGQGAKVVWDTFNSLPDWVKTAVITGWGLNKLTGGAVGGLLTNVAQGLLTGGLKTLFGGLFSRGSSPANPMFVQGTGIGGGGAGPGGVVGAAGGASKLVQAVSIISIVGSALAVMEAFKEFLGTRDQAQNELDAKANAAAHQTAQEALGNLQGLNATLGKQGLWESLVTNTFGAAQTSKGITNLADAIVNNGKVSDVSAAIKALQDAQAVAIQRGWTDAADAIGADIVKLQTTPASGPTPVVPGPGFTEWMHSQTTQTDEQKQELERLHNVAAAQLPEIAKIGAGVAGLPSKLSAFIAQWSGAHDAAIAAGFKAGTQAIRQEIASKLGITVRELGSLRGAFRSALASELGITTGELRRLNRTFDYDETKIAAKLGISVEQLRQLKAEAQTTAANTTKIKNKDWTPEITVPVKVTTTFSVSGRAVAQASERFWSINRPRVT